MGSVWVSISSVLLSTWAPSGTPYLHIEGGSEQRPPLYLGSTARELSLGQRGQGAAITPELLDTVRTQSVIVARVLKRSKVELEAWPSQDDHGQRTWAFARYRENARAPWKWISRGEMRRARWKEALQGIPRPIFAQTARSWIADERTEIFTDFAERDELYVKPIFGECVWTDESGARLWGAWLPLRERESFAEQSREFARGDRPVCHALPQPARLHGEAISFVIGVDGGQVRLPRELLQGAEIKADLPPEEPTRAIPRFSVQSAEFQKDVQRLNGEVSVRDKNGALTRLERRNNSDPDNQLAEVIEYLERRYAALGVPTQRQSLEWRGMKQANLIARVAGTGSRAGGAPLAPIILIDHIDAAYSEDTFDQRGLRVSAPGADDNAAATAGLLQAARTFKEKPPVRDVWLVHITGEEFPADGLGARVFASELLRTKQAVRAVLVMDMIAYRAHADDAIFQINAGETAESRQIAQIAMGAAHYAAGVERAVLRERFDPLSYLYNTDAVTFSDVGYPTVLFNEHINAIENWTRPHYHQSSDLTGTLDWQYAESILRTVLATVYLL